MMWHLRMMACVTLMLVLLGTAFPAVDTREGFDLLGSITLSIDKPTYTIGNVANSEAILSVVTTGPEYVDVLQIGLVRAVNVHTDKRGRAIMPTAQEIRYQDAAFFTREAMQFFPALTCPRMLNTTANVSNPAAYSLATGLVPNVIGAYTFFAYAVVETEGEPTLTVCSKPVTVTINNSPVPYERPSAPLVKSTASAGATNAATGDDERGGLPHLTVDNPRGPDVSFGMTYSTACAKMNYSSPGLSAGWVHSYDIAVEDQRGSLCLRYPNGARDPLTLGADGMLKAPSTAPYAVIASQGTVVNVEGQLIERWSVTLRYDDGTTQEFVPDDLTGISYLKRAKDLQGRDVTFTYAKDGRLEKITSHLSKDLLTCVYNEDNLLEYITDEMRFGPWLRSANGMRVDYTYNAEDELASISWQHRPGEQIRPRWELTYFPYTFVTSNKPGNTIHLLRNFTEIQTNDATNPLANLTVLIFEEGSCRLIKVDEGTNQTKFIYDLADPLTGNSVTTEEVYKFGDATPTLTRIRQIASGRCVSTQESGQNAVTYTYGDSDCPAKPSTITGLDGLPTQYNYGTYGEILSIDTLDGSGDVSYEYEAGDNSGRPRVKKIERVVGTPQGPQVFTLAEYTYTSFRGRDFVKIENRLIPGSTVGGKVYRTTSYTYDFEANPETGLGNITCIDAPGKDIDHRYVTDFTYTDANQPVAEYNKPVKVVTRLAHKTGENEWTYYLLNTVTYTYDNGTGKVQSVTDRPNNTETAYYHPDGRQYWQQNALGGITYSTYNTHGLLHQQSMYRGIFDYPYHEGSYTYDYLSPEGAITKLTTDPHFGASWATGTDYTPENRVRVENKWEDGGLQTSYVYDHLGRVIEVWHGQLVTSYSYLITANGTQISETQPNGVVTITKYDLMGRVTETRQQNDTASYEYSDLGQAEYIRTYRSVDGTNKLVEESRFSYNSVTGLVINKTVNYYTYNQGQGVIFACDIITYDYDLLGNVISTTTHNHRNNQPDTIHTIVTQVDHLGRVTTRTEDGQVTGYTYDELFPTTGGTFGLDGDNNTIVNAGDLLIAITVTKPDNTVVQQAVDVWGRKRLLRTGTKDNGITTWRSAGTRYVYTRVDDPENTFTQLDRVTTTYPDDTTEIVFYDCFSRKTASYDRKGSGSSYNYSLDRLSTEYINWVDNGFDIYFAERVHEYDWTASGRLASVNEYHDVMEMSFLDDYDIEHIRTYSYEGPASALSRMFTDDVEHDVDFAVNYQYKTTGELEKMTAGYLGEFTYGYDAEYRINAVTSPHGHTTTWEYDWHGGIRKQTLANGAYTLLDTVPGKGELIGLSHFGAPSAPGLEDGLLRAQYSTHTYDGRQRTTGYGRANLPGLPAPETTPQSFAYDAQRLTLATEAAYGLAPYSADAYGNLLSLPSPAGMSRELPGFENTTRYTRAYDEDNMDRWIGYHDADQNGLLVGENAFDYDDNGNPTTYKGTPLGFDPLNRLRFYNITDPDENPADVVADRTFDYTFDGLRHWAKDAEGHYIHYVYDADGQLLGTIERVEGQPFPVCTSIQTWGLLGVVERNDARGAVYYQYDPQGNVALRTGQDATVRSADSFDAFGLRVGIVGPYAAIDALDPLAYRAQYGYTYDAALGFYYLHHRYYDPGAGRFLTEDPIGYDGGLNLYRYCENEPVNAVDPEGLWGEKQPHETEWLGVKRKSFGHHYVPWAEFTHKGPGFTKELVQYFQDSQSGRFAGGAGDTHPQYNKATREIIEEMISETPAFMWRKNVEGATLIKRIIESTDPRISDYLKTIPDDLNQAALARANRDLAESALEMASETTGDVATRGLRMSRGSVNVKVLGAIASIGAVAMFAGPALEGIGAGHDIHDATMKINAIDDRLLANLDPETRQDYLDVKGDAYRTTKEWAESRKDMSWWRSWWIYN